MTSPRPLDLHPYVPDAVLGRGGMGTVYRASHVERPEERVAIKVLRPDQGALARRLRREGLVQARLDDPHVVRVLDTLERPSGPALVLEYVRGPSLADWLPSEPLPLPVIDALARGILAGVAAAHRAGVTHRDLKPGNVLLAVEEQRLVPRVGDFGLARIDVAVDSLDTASGMIVGTPRYMAPEQLRDARRTSPRSDVFALGALLYELITGVPCFGQDDPVARMGHITAGRYTPMASHRADVPEAWREVVAAALSPVPDARPGHAGEVLAAWTGAQVPSAPWPPALLLRGRRGHRPEPLVALPTFDDAWIGRAALRRDLGAAVVQCALTTVVGVGGVGKTRLAVEVARARIPDSPGGVWFCDLTDARSADGITHAVAAALSIPLGEDAVQTVGAALRGRGRSLVVLDNFEQVVEHAPATVEVWRRAAPDARFLVTSRAPLGLDGEHVVPVDALSLDADAQTGDALALFEVRAADALPGFTLGEDNREAALDIVSRLGGLPLAIEIVAARVRQRSLARLQEKLSGRLHRLPRRGRSDSTHRRTLEATFRWSWDLLSGAERSALAQLGVFEGGCTRRTAHQVLSLEGVAVDDALDALVARSLVRRRDERFGLLSPVAEYARRRLRDGAVPGLDPAAVRARHVAAFARLGDPDVLDVLRTDSRQFERHAAELDNLVAAARAAVAQDDLHGAASATLGACAVLLRTGPHRTAIALLGEVLDRLPTAEPRLWLALAEAAFAAGWYDEVLRAVEHCAAAEPGLEARAMLLRAQVVGIQGDLEASVEALEDAALRAAEADLPHVVGRCLVARANGLYHLGRVQEVLPLLGEALDHGRRAADLRLQARVRGAEAAHYLQEGHYGRAEGAYEQSLQLFRRAGDVQGEAGALSGLATLQRDQGQLSRARATFAEALRLERRLGDRRGEARTASNLGNLHMRAGEYERSKAVLVEALQQHIELGDLPWQGFVRSSLAIVLADLGDLRASYEEHHRALGIFEQIGERNYTATAQVNCADILKSLGELDRSEAHARAALAGFEALDHQLGMAIAFNNLGCLAARRGEDERAWALLQEGLSLQRRAQEPSHLATYLGLFAREALAMGRHREAEACGREALALLASVEGPDTERADVRATLGTVALREGRTEEATTLLELAGDVLPVAPDVRVRVHILCALAELAHAMGAREQSDAHLAAAEAVVVDVGAGPGSELVQRIARLRARVGP